MGVGQKAGPVVVDATSEVTAAVVVVVSSVVEAPVSVVVSAAVMVVVRSITLDCSVVAEVTWVEMAADVVTGLQGPA